MATAPTTALDNTDEHSTTALYRAAIGEVNSAYYLPLFTRFEAADRAGLSWNWSAALYTLNWLAFRQLWNAALLYLGCVVAVALSVFGIGRLVFQFSEGTQWGLLAALVALAVAVPGLGGNALLHSATRKRMQAALTASTTVPEACTLLARQASTRRRLIVQAVLNLLLAAAAAYSWTHFNGFEPLPGHTDRPADKVADTRNLAIGRATDATAPAASAPVPSASSPIASAALPASAAVAAPARPAASAAVTTAAPAIAASAPKAAASTPLAAPAPAKPAVTKPVETKPVVDTKPAVPPQTAASQPVRAKAKPARPAPTATEPVAAVTRPAPTGRFIVNVGIFADENNARNAFVRLMDADLPANSKAFQARRGPRTRVWVGPFDTQTEADTAAEKIRTFGLDALVAPE